MRLIHPRSWILPLAVMLSLVTAQAHAESPETQILEHFEALSTSLEAVGGQCDPATKVINAWLDENKETLPELSLKLEARLEEMSDAQRMAFEQKMTPSFSVMMRLTMKDCAMHEGYQEAFQRVDAVMSGGEEPGEQELDD